jgi:hypothetical protein
MGSSQGDRGRADSPTRERKSLENEPMCEQASQLSNIRRRVPKKRDRTFPWSKTGQIEMAEENKNK